MSETRVAVVTGGASGIGEATARRFVAARLDGRDRRSRRRRGTGVAAEIGAGFTALDVVDDQAAEAFAATVWARHGGVRALVNSAGILQNAVRATEMDMAEFDRIHDVNTRAVLLMNRAFGAAMAGAGQGAIVNLGSLTSFRPSGQPAYAIGKAAIRMMTEVLAAELGPRGVRVNAVAPGYVLTPAMQARIDSGQRDPAAHGRALGAPPPGAAGRRRRGDPLPLLGRRLGDHRGHASRRLRLARGSAYGAYAAVP